ncbi:hypothetical protein JBL43_14430 [Aureibaculum sp. A20]|uniref:SMODS-associating 2TM beta-strand rich effector domain-containing protein n=1 Tax=Aureibaculum flavum TaxID=2795986 RepID=A0ABS0WTZ6_9FLAO|nr:hypothetical protein [Aureibaculum flavum]MBJ2175445.1 hypothetical protein [Aureibaculum flavum]
MRPRSLEIYKRRKGIYISPENSIAISLTILVFLLEYLVKQFGFDFDGWDRVIGMLLLFYVFILITSNFFRYERDIGEHFGKIVFWEDRVQLGSCTYKLSEIEKLAFPTTYDVRGIHTNLTLEFSPSKSNGMDNVLILTLKNGKKLEYNFLQTENYKLTYFKDIFVHYYKHEIISWIELIGILNVHDYRKIQEFKKEIHT